MIVRHRRGVGRPVRRGVSLIEVLLATAIFLISLAAISVLVRGASDNAADAARINLCSRLARMKMAELEAGVADVTLSAGGSGVFNNYPNYQWQVVSVPTTAPYTYDVTVRVTNPYANRPTEVSLSQVILDPTLLNNAAPLQLPVTEEEVLP